MSSMKLLEERFWNMLQAAILQAKRPACTQQAFFQHAPDWYVEKTKQKPN